MNAAAMSINATTFRDNTTSTLGEILNTGTLTMTDSVVTHNFATSYGTILNGAQAGGGPAQMTLINCTVSGNRVYAFGAAFINRGTLTLASSTVTGNANLIGYSYFGAIQNYGGLFLEDSIVAGNTTTDSDVSGSFGGDPWVYNPDVPLEDVSYSPADPSSSHNLLGPDRHGRPGRRGQRQHRRHERGGPAARPRGRQRRPDVDGGPAARQPGHRRGQCGPRRPGDRPGLRDPLPAGRLLRV